MAPSKGKDKFRARRLFRSKGSAAETTKLRVAPSASEERASSSSEPGERQDRDDGALIRSCNQGRAEEAKLAFEALYRRHKTFVFRVALRLVGDQDSALDVVQETFVYLLRQFPPAGTGIRADTRLTTLLYPVAKHTAISLLRKARRFRIDPDAVLEELPAAGESQDEDLRRVLSTLPREQRETLLLRFVDDLSLQEIARALDVPLGTVKSRLHHGVAKLKASKLVRDFRE